MQLLIKLYDDKPPRFGVIYPSEFQASKAFEALTEKFTGDNFKAIFEPLGDKVNLTLLSIHGSGRITMKGLECKAEQLKKLQHFVRPGTDIEFVPVYWKENKLYVAKVKFRNAAPMIISEYEIAEN